MERGRGLQGDTESAFTQFRSVESLNYGLGVQVERIGQSEALCIQSRLHFHHTLPQYLQIEISIAESKRERDNSPLQKIVPKDPIDIPVAEQDAGWQHPEF